MKNEKVILVHVKYHVKEEYAFNYGTGILRIKTKL